MIARNFQDAEASSQKPVPIPEGDPSAGREPVELRPLLERILINVHPDLETQKVRLVHDIAGGLPLVRGNASDLRRAFTAIIRCALVAMPRGGRLSVSVSYVSENGLPGKVVVRVEDTGLGMAGEHGDRAFQSFSPVQPGGLRETGMAEARAVVISSGGSLAMETEPGIGSALIVSLPAHRPIEGVVE